MNFYRSENEIEYFVFKNKWDNPDFLILNWIDKKENNITIRKFEEIEIIFGIDSNIFNIAYSNKEIFKKTYMENEIDNYIGTIDLETYSLDESGFQKVFLGGYCAGDYIKSFYLDKEKNIDDKQLFYLFLKILLKKDLRIILFMYII